MRSRGYIGNERDSDCRESVQRMERSVHEVDRKTERRVNQLAEDNGAHQGVEEGIG